MVCRRKNAAPPFAGRVRLRLLFTVLIPLVSGVHAALETIVGDVSRTKFVADAGQVNTTNPFVALI